MKLSVKNLYKWHQGQDILKNISFEISGNDFLSVLGPLRALTALGEILTGFIPLSSGEIYLNERDITTLKPYEREIAIVAKKSCLKDNLTVFDNIAYPLRENKVKEDEVELKVTELINDLDLSVIQSCVPKELSTYQKLKVSLVRAALYKPKIIILEDPLSLIEDKRREEYLSYLKKITDYLKDVNIIYLGQIIPTANKLLLIGQDGSLLSFGNKKIGISYAGSLEEINLLSPYIKDNEVKLLEDKNKAVLISSYLKDNKLYYGEEKTFLDDVTKRRFLQKGDISYLKLDKNLFSSFDYSADFKFKIKDIKVENETSFLYFDSFYLIKNYSKDYFIGMDMYYPRGEVIYLDQEKKRMNSLRNIYKNQLKIRVINGLLGLIEIEGNTFLLKRKTRKDMTTIVLKNERIYDLSKDKRDGIKIERIETIEEFADFYNIYFQSIASKDTISLKIKKDDDLLKQEKVYIKMRVEDLADPSSFFTNS